VYLNLNRADRIAADHIVDMPIVVSFDQQNLFLSVLLRNDQAKYVKKCHISPALFPKKLYTSLLNFTIENKQTLFYDGTVNKKRDTLKWLYRD
jgi:hypothetical protein